MVLNRTHIDLLLRLFTMAVHHFRPKIGLNFQWGEEGIFGMSLSPIKSDGFRTLFFHPLSSNREFAVSTGILRNRERATSEESYHDYQVLDERSSLAHSTAEVQTDDGIMFYSLVDHNAVGCWNSRNPYKPENQGVIDRDDVGLVFPADVKIDSKNTLWVLSDRMPVFLIAELDFSETNFFLYSVAVDDAVRGTVCDFHPGQALTELQNVYKAPFVSSVKAIPTPNRLSVILPSTVAEENNEFDAAAVLPAHTATRILYGGKLAQGSSLVLPASTSSVSYGGKSFPGFGFKSIPRQAQKVTYVF